MFVSYVFIYISHDVPYMSYNLAPVSIYIYIYIYASYYVRSILIEMHPPGLSPYDPRWVAWEGSHFGEIATLWPKSFCTRLGELELKNGYGIRLGPWQPPLVWLTHPAVPILQVRHWRR